MIEILIEKPHPSILKRCPMDQSDAIQIIEAGREHLVTLIPLFDAYRVFYEMESDLQGARSYLGERIRKQESVIFLALSGRKVDDCPHFHPATAAAHGPARGP